MEYIKEDRLLKTFIQLVEIDCESYHERKIADYLKNHLNRLGIIVHEDGIAVQLKEICQKTLHEKSDPAGNLWGCLPGNLEDDKKNRENAILLSAHMDTVHPGVGKKPIIHPDKTITSDGTTVLGADDATALAQILEILQILKDENIPHPDIEFLFSAAEEPYCQGSRLFDYRQLHAKCAYVLDLSGPVGRAAHGAPSILSLYIHVHGKSAHAGFSPEKGIHAIYIAAKAIEKIPYGHVEDDTTINFGTIHGGLGKNIVPEDVWLTGEIRSMSSQKANDWANQISHTFKKYAEQLGGEVDITIESEVRSYLVSEEAKVTQLFKKAAKHLNLPGKLIQTFGGSDNNYLNANGIEGLVLAQGMNDVHSVCENTNIHEMVKSIELLLEIIRLSIQDELNLSLL